MRGTVLTKLISSLAVAGFTAAILLFAPSNNNQIDRLDEDRAIAFLVRADYHADEITIVDVDRLFTHVLNGCDQTRSIAIQTRVIDQGDTLSLTVCCDVGLDSKTCRLARTP